MRKKTLVVAVIGALFAGGLVGGATVALAQADVIKQRQDNRKAAGAAMRGIKGVVDAKGDVKEAAPHIAKLKELEAAFVKLFPAGSDKGETKALPAVWTDMAGFQKASANAMAAYDAMGKAADAAALGAAFAETGKACGACHNAYRAKQN